MATEILRPNGVGDEDNLLIAGWDPALTNWENVDEVTTDNAMTMVRENRVVYTTYRRDLYNITNSSGSGTINHITVYALCVCPPNATQPSLKVAIKTSGTAYEGNEETLTGDWVLYSKQWVDNPADNQPWEWGDIDSLQIGIAMRSARSAMASSTDCTQNYVVIDYTEEAVGFTRKIKISGTFQDKPIKTKVAGTFEDKPIKIKVGGTFQDA